MPSRATPRGCLGEQTCHNDVFMTCLPHHDCPDFSAEEKTALLFLKAFPTVVLRLEQLSVHSFVQPGDRRRRRARQRGGRLVGGCWRNSPQVRAALAATIAQPKPPEPASPPPSPTACENLAPSPISQTLPVATRRACPSVFYELSSFRHHGQRPRCPYTVKGYDDPLVNCIKAIP